ncbi:MAG: MBOAT family O-acyltransferase [Muribaculaceae bacterium]
MPLTSISFVLFFVVVFFIYWLPSVKDKKVFQNYILLASSLVFYAFFDVKFLILLVASSLVFFKLGRMIFLTTNENNKKYILWLGLAIALLMLGYFKYTNFFIGSVVSFMNMLNINVTYSLVQIFAPIGISFYTFRLISYLIDIYNEEYEPQENVVMFSTYIAFFPCIIAGPIDRPGNFIGQLKVAREFNYGKAIIGCQQILWGLFKKFVVADNCAVIVNIYFGNVEMHSGSTLLIGACLYLIQLYADFSGYSDIAIGFARLLGLQVTQNFNYPLFATNIADFWHRWHISLTSWLTDYVFTPLSFIMRKYGKLGAIIAVLINFAFVGLWHGANWTYVIHGLINGLFFIPLILIGRTKERGRLRTFINMIFTFLLMSIIVVIFRAGDISQAWDYYYHMFSRSLFSVPEIANIKTFVFVVILIGIEWVGRKKEFPIESLPFKSRVIRWTCYYMIILAIIFFSGKQTTFIYSQF